MTQANLKDLSKDGRKDLKKQLDPQLQHGDLRELVTTTGLSYNYVRAVLDPETTSWNENIIQAAIDLIEKRKAADSKIKAA